MNGTSNNLHATAIQTTAAQNASAFNKIKRKLLMLGPAFIAAIGYIDPGNFATNIESGSSLAINCFGLCFGQTSWRC